MDEPVQETGDDAAISKVSMSELGYVNDPFISLFVKKVQRRSPLINRGYYSRSAAVWNIINEFLNCDKDVLKQIVSLGSGFDSTYFRLKHANKKFHRYIELDLLTTQQRKASIIKKHKKLREIISSDDDISINNKDILIQGDDYSLIAGDIRNISEVELLFNECNVNYNIPTLFLSECVLVYIKPEDSAQLINWVSDSFNQAAFIVYEQLYPNDAFGKVMMDNLRKRSAPLRSLTTYPTPESQQQRFLNYGWLHVCVRDMNNIYNQYLPRDDIQRIERIEMFDEFEEWHLIQAHYCIVMAVKDDNNKHKSLLLKHPFINNNINDDNKE